MSERRSGPRPIRINPETGEWEDIPSTSTAECDGWSLCKCPYHRRLEEEKDAARSWRYNTPCPSCGHKISDKHESFCSEGSMGTDCVSGCSCDLSEEDATLLLAYRAVQNNALAKIIAGAQGDSHAKGMR